MAQVQQFSSYTEESLLLPQSETKSEPRFDTQTVQEVIALAAQLQTEHQETLSLSQIEAIGSEVGLAPDFVQRALAQLIAEGYTERKKATGQQTTTLRLTELTRRSKAIAVLVPVVYG